MRDAGGKIALGLMFPALIGAIGGEVGHSVGAARGEGFREAWSDGSGGH